jgi:hypothetical protein
VYFGKMLADDEEEGFGGRAFVERSVEWIKRNEDPEFVLPKAWISKSSSAGALET